MVLQLTRSHLPFLTIRQGLLHFKSLIRETSSFHRHVGVNLGVEWAAEFLMMRALNSFHVCTTSGGLAQQLYRHSAHGLLVPVPDLIQPLIEIQRTR